jgi:branched-chain amino acid transport system substrate-binding protein
MAGVVASRGAFAANPVKVGLILPFSGVNALSGGEVWAGVTLAIEEFNAANSASGLTVEVLKEDDGGVPSTGVSAVRKLIERDKVVAILGSQTTGVTLPASEVTRQAKIPHLAAGAAGTVLTATNKKGDPWCFRHIPGSEQQGRESATDAVKRLDLTRIAIVYENTAYGRSLAETFGKVAKDNGATIVAQEHYEQGEQEFYTLLTRVKATNPNGVYLAGLIAEGAAMLRQAGEINFKTRFIGSGGMVTDSLIKLAGPASEGFGVTVQYEPNTPSPLGKAFGEKFQKRFNIPGNTLSGLGYDAGRIMFDAIKRAKSMSGVDIRDSLLTSSVEIVEGPPGSKVSFDDMGASYFKLGLAIVKNGQRVLLPYDDSKAPPL